jgi:imidazolonepropionase
VPALTNIGVLATCRRDGGQDAVHLIRDAALAWDGGRITWVGEKSELPPDHTRGGTIDAGGRLVVPGLIDCHTHLAFGGWRAGEFVERLRGRSYLDIAQSGGGIASTVRATRAAGSAELIARCEGWLREAVRLGVTTLEAKSGYGLTEDEELRLLSVYAEVSDRSAVRLVPTFLGAHTIPPEFQERRAEYVDLVCGPLMTAVAARRLARFCDVFVEESAFTVDEARRVLAAACACGLGTKVHADQLTDGGGAALAVEMAAASADHLDCVARDGVARLAGSATVAVSLPVATLYLGRPPMPARALIDAGVPVAVATDFNPGTAPTLHLPFAMLLACTLQRMTPAEALKGATIYAAMAIGEADVCGSLEPGKRTDFAIVDAPDVDHWLYHFAANRCVATYIGGEPIFTAQNFSR